MDNNFFMNETLFNIGKIVGGKVWLPQPGHEYDIITYEDRAYLRRSVSSNWPKESISTNSFSSNKNCVIDLLKVVNYNSCIHWNNVSRHINKNKLLKWCYKYGLPNGNFRIKITYIDGRQCVEYDLVCYDMVVMRLVFDLWNQLINRDIEGIKKIIRLISDCEYFKEIAPDKKLIFLEGFMPFKSSDELVSSLVGIINTNHPRSLDFICCSIFASIFQTVLRDSCFYEISSPHLSREYKIGAPLLEITPHCELLDFCYLQLYAIINSRDGTKYFKECANLDCRQQFWASHGRQKYCNSCDRRTVWAKKNAKKVKERRTVNQKGE